MSRKQGIIRQRCCVYKANKTTNGNGATRLNTFVAAGKYLRVPSSFVASVPPFFVGVFFFLILKKLFGTMYKLIKKRRENGSDRQTGSSYTNSRPSSPSCSCALPLERRSAHEEPGPATKSQLQPLISSLPALRNATIFPPSEFGHQNRYPTRAVAPRRDPRRRLCHELRAPLSPSNDINRRSWNRANATAQVHVGPEKRHTEFGVPAVRGPWLHHRGVRSRPIRGQVSLVRRGRKQADVPLVGVGLGVEQYDYHIIIDIIALIEHQCHTPATGCGNRASNCLQYRILHFYWLHCFAIWSPTTGRRNQWSGFTLHHVVRCSCLRFYLELQGNCVDLFFLFCFEGQNDSWL